MLGNTNFVQFNENKSNMIDDATYTSSDYRKNGCRTGLAPSNQHNKLFYQVSTMTTAIAIMLSNRGYNVYDSDLDSLVAVLSTLSTRDKEMAVFKVAGNFEFTVPATCGYKVTVVGGGGAGGSSSATMSIASAGGGGGAGGTATKNISLVAGNKISIVVGAGGTGVISNKGNDGSTSSFGSYCSASGGIGGGFGLGSKDIVVGFNNLGLPGIGGIGLNGDINAQGGHGKFGGLSRPWYETSGGLSGAGGTSSISEGAFYANNGNGIAGVLGAGGSGADCSNLSGDFTGGNGGDGIVIIEW